ncbi:galactose-1-phosphate uridylyltransferase [candidate division WOR-1 bacterium RIFOXYA12_FULL_52_29]|uniref:Galactose-1-phosphate uridylyltransferase n=1 Tax=candidate division WOR-1 bacterium RIFOXYC12_FULL_54_18 TaxID=1802584 RepID=A0A1F4T4F1_UNCSA|nr:MAG: galactose-1-phosphate uridylyltransferase [candidate division WOR-1 bacterium RIFOXYA2_FULL_51_19]OGC17215.1 MAG: galactose-1-phosphate uridylyltransferase [candidate division WOR-1 bacterium RIFOXYA12_FULL_52_29]OGC26075.1 MAG: galactose-1-phosphate uridylyltransferase [candidate division WOR-1 bacterium RIFOXYB2_FULL_45_9]OGC27632.1 MAG: galactose-1-phosphate uridylyltransferase [candidate division WOR-1 bacterium RIFOXYC12_FULL_54_18]OGC29154.1 MAG: galactose-1-phosphate uridylyltran
MPELRKDPISDRWVVVSTERGRRPSDFGSSPTVEGAGESKFCPFDEGNEGKTPKEIIAWRKPNTAPDTPGWDVRVTPNKFPALVIEGEVNRTGMGIFDMMSGIGAHEVIIETPNHNLNIADMEESHIDKILWAYKQRIVDLEKDKRFRYILVFKNYGTAAGASLAHPHSQLIATPITPRYVKLELASARSYFLEKERCIFCDMIRQELGTGERMVYENEYFVAFTPFASRFPFELWLLPRRHEAGFQELPDEERMQLARCLKDIMMRLKKTLNDPPYNYVIHTAPNSVPRPGKPDYWGTINYDFHWHIEIIPRLTKQAGFEWGSGLYINPTAPEEAAKYLREVKI